MCKARLNEICSFVSYLHHMYYDFVHESCRFPLNIIPLLRAVLVSLHILLIHLDIRVQLLLKLSVSHGSPLVDALGLGTSVSSPRESASVTSVSRLEVMQMSINIQTKSTTVTSQVGSTFTDLDIADGVVNRVATTVGQPELGGCVSVSEDQRGKTRDRVLGVCDTVFSTSLV
jgi:hypothetical protein